MSHFGIIKRGSPTPTPTASPLALANNVAVPDWYTNGSPFTNTAFSAPATTIGNAGFIGSTTSNPILDANRDINGNVKSVPGGEAAIAFVSQLPPTNAQRVLTWASSLGGSNTGVATMVMTAGFVGGSVIYDLPNRKVTYTPSGIADGTSGGTISFAYTPAVSGTDYPISFSDDLVAGSGGLVTEPLYSSLFTATCSASRIARLLDWVTVNRCSTAIHETATPGKTISSITFVGTRATVTTSTAHGLLGNGTGSASASVTVSGVTPSTYNVTDAYVKVISPTQFQYTMGGTPTGNATVVGSYTVGDADFQFTNLHYPVAASEPGTQFGEPIYTSVNRNRNGADALYRDGVKIEKMISLFTECGISPYYPATFNCDATFLSDSGTLFAAFSLSTGKPCFLSRHNEVWNSAFKVYHQARNEANLRGTLVDAKTACRLIDQAGVALSGAQTVDGVAVVTGDRILRAVGSDANNGVWIANTAGAWTRATDADANGELLYRDIWLVTSGLTYAQTSWFLLTNTTIIVGSTPFAITQLGPHHRYAEKLIEAADAWRTAFASAGVSSLLNVVAEWQTYSATSIWDDMAAFVGPTNWAKVTHLSVGAYYADNGGAALVAAGIGLGYTGSTVTLKAAIQQDQDDVIGAIASHAAKAQATGKKFIIYEGGNTLNQSDLTYKTSWTRSSDQYDLELRMLQQLELRVGTLVTGGITHTQYNLNFPLTGSNFSWGLIEALARTRDKTSAPKYQAHVDFLAGTRVLGPATGALGSVANSASAGASLGFLSPSAYGVTWSLVDTDGGRVTVNAATGEFTVTALLAGTSIGTRNVTVRQTIGASNFDTVKSYSVAAAYSSVRIRTTATQAGSGVAVAEVRGRSSSAGANLLLSRPATATSETFGAATNAVDGDTTTFYASDFGGTWPQILTIPLASPSVIAAVDIVARIGSQATQSPGDFTIEGFDGASWNVLKTLTGQAYVSGETKTFTIP